LGDGSDTKRKRDYKRENKNRKKLDTETKKKQKEKTSRKRAAKQVHLSDETLRKYQYVLKNGKPELVEKIKINYLIFFLSIKKSVYC
jgi:hypothetical protein